MPPTPERREKSLPADLRPYSVIGSATMEVARALYEERQEDFFQIEDSFPFRLLGRILGRFGDDDAARILTVFGDLWRKQRAIDVTLFEKWVETHPANAEQVIACMQVDPPEELQVLDLLSTQGSQKLVFLAQFRNSASRVVLKRVLGPDATSIIGRESDQHPLSMEHPNIIDTFVSTNRSGEKFLVEKLLPEVLSDGWRANGIKNAANLLHDIAAALTYIHARHLVHSDIKPANIGKNGENFVLLDFGLSRQVELFTADTHPTGSLRTRAPELLTEGRYLDAFAADVWALGATVFNACTGRFPLTRLGEDIPRVSQVDPRKEFVELLKRRAEEEWDQLVTFAEIPEPLQDILNSILQRNPSDRISAADLHSLVEKKLSPFLHSPTHGFARPVYFSAIDELNQIDEFLHREGRLGQLPSARRIYLQERLAELEGIYGFDSKTKALATELRKALESGK